MSSRTETTQICIGGFQTSFDLVGRWQDSDGKEEKDATGHPNHDLYVVQTQKPVKR